MWKKGNGSKEETCLTGTEKRFVSWDFLFCARTSVMQVSPFLPSFKLLCTGDCLLLLKTLTRVCLSKLSQKLTGRKASMAPVSGELGEMLKRAKSQRTVEIEPHIQADEEKAKPLKYCLSICLLWQPRGNKQLGKIMTYWKIQYRYFCGRGLGKLVIRKKTSILTWLCTVIFLLKGLKVKVKDRVPTLEIQVI